MKKYKRVTLDEVAPGVCFDCKFLKENKAQLGAVRNLVPECENCKKRKNYATHVQNGHFNNQTYFEDATDYRNI